MPLEIFIQCSLGRYPLTVEEEMTLRAVKNKFRQEEKTVMHVNFKSFRFNVNGTFLSDESKTLAQCGIAKDDTLHLVKKTACPAAAIDTEKKAEDE